MEDNRTPPKEMAKKMLKATGKVDAISLAQQAVDSKRKEKPSSLGMMIWVDEINYLREVLENIEAME